MRSVMNYFVSQNNFLRQLCASVCSHTIPRNYFLKEEIFSKSGIHENPETEEKIIYLKTDASLQPEEFSLVREGDAVQVFASDKRGFQ